MLLLGTNDHLEDLDRQYSLAEDVAVSAIGVAAGGLGMRDAYALLDGARVVRVDEFEVMPVATLGNGAAKGQSMAAADGALLVGLTGANLVVVDVRDGRVSTVDSFGTVPGRDQWENPAATSPDLRSIAVTREGAWLVDVHVGGLWRSTDGGTSWENVVPPGDDVHEVVAGDDGVVVAAAARGFGWSKDDGQTWEWTTDGLHAHYCRAVAVAGDVAYVSASTGPSTTDGRLYRGRLGEPLEPCGGGLPASFPYNLDTGSLAAHAAEVAVGTRDGHVWRSGDGGDTFEAVTERVGRVRVLRFA